MSIGPGWYPDSEPFLDELDDIAIQLLKEKFDMIFGALQEKHENEPR